jgi:hypothetical protein
VKFQPLPFTSEIASSSLEGESINLRANGLAQRPLQRLVRPVSAVSLTISGVQLQVWQWFYAHVRLGVRPVKPDMAESLSRVVLAALATHPDIQCCYVQEIPCYPPNALLIFCKAAIDH